MRKDDRRPPGRSRRDDRRGPPGHAPRPERQHAQRPERQQAPRQERQQAPRPERPPTARQPKPWRASARDRDGPVILYGWHSVKAALENPARKFHKLLVTENALHRLKDDGVPLPIEPQLVRGEAIAALVGPDAVHQGLLVEADPLASPDIDDIEAQGVVLVLDQITDPHNVGAILRSAAAFGVTAVVTTSRHSPEATGALAKAASGALEYVPMVTVPNLARALEALKQKNVFVVGLDSDADVDLAEAHLGAPLALVLGAEGKGLRQLTRATCDQVARVSLPGKLRSLNVSNATTLALYVATSRGGDRP